MKRTGTLSKIIFTLFITASMYYGGCAWENQAMFDFGGKPLESLKTWALVKTGNEIETVPDAVKDSEVTVKLGEPIILPDKVFAIYSDRSEQAIDVAWEPADLEAMTNGEPAEYTVKGMAGGSETVCRIAVTDANYAVNYGFENEDRSMWVIENINNITTQTDYQKKSLDAAPGRWRSTSGERTGPSFAYIRR